MNERNARFYQSVKEQIKVPDIIRRYSGVALKSGTGRCSCPLPGCPGSKQHNEFHILGPDKFYCFSCQGNGDQIALAATLNGTGYFDAAKQLCSDFGLFIEVPEYGTYTQKPTQKQNEVSKEALRIVNFRKEEMKKYQNLRTEMEHDNDLIRSCVSAFRHCCRAYNTLGSVLNVRVPELKNLLEDLKKTKNNLIESCLYNEKVLEYSFDLEKNLEKIGEISAFKVAAWTVGMDRNYGSDLEERLMYREINFKICHSSLKAPGFQEEFNERKKFFELGLKTFLHQFDEAKDSLFKIYDGLNDKSIDLLIAFDKQATQSPLESFSSDLRDDTFNWNDLHLTASKHGVVPSVLDDCKQLIDKKINAYHMIVSPNTIEPGKQNKTR